MTRLRVDVCTIIAKNYLAHARVLAESFRAHHPDGVFYVLVLDDHEGYFDPEAEPFELLTPADLGIDGFEEMAAVYDVLELSTAVKPWLLRTLLERTSGAGVVYLDPDIEVFASLEAIEGLMRERGLVLIPHVTAPMPRDGRKPSESDILIAGAFNLGFIGLGNDQAAQELLDWWSERLRTDCRVDPEHGYFVDQRWMDFAPGIVPRLEVLRDPGYDVAYWNLPSRSLSRHGAKYLVDSRPLRFFHFSGYDPERRDELSRHQDRIVLRADPLLSELCDRYGDALVSHGHLEVKSWPYSYSELAGGIALNRPMRRMLTKALDEGRVTGSIFEESGAQQFLAWLNEPASRGAAHGVTRFLLDVYEQRPDLQRVYPDLGGADGEGLVGWARVHGRLELPIASELLPPAQEDPPARRRRVPAPSPALEGPAPASERPWGVNVAGYLTSELGVGEAARLLIRALDARSVPLSPIGLLAPLSRQGHHFSAGVPSFPYPINVLCVNADGLPGFVAELGTAFAGYRYTIGLWFWEVSTFPERWVGSFDYLDEVWVASDHIARALAPHAPIPVSKMTLPIEPQPGALLSRERLGLPQGFVFLFVFDYNSVAGRKNPLGLVDAFTRAFPSIGHASLVIKSINHERAMGEHQRLLDAKAQRPDIHVIDSYVSLQEKNSMIAACDCYVSLHRSEGFGLTMGEAMAYGRPVIATGFSGNMDFMTGEGAWLVRHSMVPIGEGNDPYPAEGEWAEPDLDHAAQLMREVFEQPEAARKRALRGRELLRATHSPAVAGAAMVRRLTQVRDLVPERPGSGEFAEGVIRNVGTGHIRERVVAGPQSVDAPKGARGTFRDAVLRAMRPYTSFEQEIDDGVLDTLDDLIGQTARGFETVRRIEASGESALLHAMRRLESTLRSDQAAAHADLREGLDGLTSGREALEARLRRLEHERTRPERWPVRVPWSHEYVATHRSFVATALDDAAIMHLFMRGARLPEGFGVGLDERAVEFPWLFAQRLGGDGLDGGSTLNHDYILERADPLFRSLRIATLVSETPALDLDRVTYEDADLRELPYEDASMDTVMCLSTLEHVGMDNRGYGSDAPRAEAPAQEALRAVRELRRVLAPGGLALLTVPYGPAEDLGWVRTLDRAEIEALAAALGPGETRVTVYRYHVGGWQISSLEEASESRYRDYTSDPRPVQDGAVAARAVACLRVAG